MSANTGDYKRWITPTSPGFSWVKNIPVEVNGLEVTQSSLVSDMQPVQHILSLSDNWNMPTTISMDFKSSIPQSR